MLGEWRGKYQLSIWIVFDKARWREAFDRLVIFEAVVFAATSRFAAILHTAASATIGCGFPTGDFSTECLGCIKDRSVSGTSAEIAVESFLYIMLRWTRIVSE
jgi:hypothetical protein